MLRIHPEMIVMDVVVTMAGDLDEMSVKGFRHWLNEVTGQGPCVVTIEASEIDSPDDDGVDALVSLAIDLQLAGGELRLLNPSLWLRRQLIHHQAGSVIAIYQTDEEELEE